jgi:hypothetical protein
MIWVVRNCSPSERDATAEEDWVGNNENERMEMATDHRVRDCNSRMG